MALNFIEGTLSWRNFHLLGRRANSVQKRIHARLASLIAVCDTPEGESIPAAPGRSGPEFIARLAELEEFARAEGHFDIRQYTGGGVKRDGEVDKKRVGKVQCREDSLVNPPYSNLQASRLKLVGTGQWRIQDFLEGPLWLPFVEPRILHHGHPLDFSLGPNLQKESKEEYIQLAKVWSALGLLRLTPDPPYQETYTRIFNAFKSSLHDRQIGDRRLANQAERRLQGPSKYLPGGYQISNIHVERGQVLIGTATDRKDFYHQCQVTPERACTNVMPFSYSSLDLLGFSEINSLIGLARVEKGRDNRGDLLGHQPRGVLVPPERLYLCFNSLLQGDHLGAFPLGPDYEGLVIDDFFCISAQPASKSAETSIAKQKLDRATEIYEAAGVKGSPEKDIKGERHFKVVGAEVDSSERAISNGIATVAAPLEKRAALAMLTLRVARLPIISATLAARLAGNWTSVFMFRRCLACILNEIYAFGSEAELTVSPVFALPRSTANELVLSSAFAFVATTNVAARYSPRVFATDASMHKGAIVSRSIPLEVSKLLWLGGDKKGTYTKLDAPFRAIRKAHEIDLNELEAEEVAEALDCIPPSLDFSFDFVEVCGGVGSVSKELAKLGRVVMPPIELSDSPHYDVREIKLIEWLCDMLRCGRLKSLMVEPVCTTFSPAAHPAIRSYKEPKGFDRANPKTLLGHVIAFRCIFLLWYASLCNCPALGEQPRLSKMCWLSIWRFLVEHKGFQEAIIASCQFGSPHRKEFRMIGKGLDMPGLETRCKGGHQHLRIAGKYTKPSAMYVQPLAAFLARHFDTALRVRAAREEDLCQIDGHESALSNDVLMTGSWRADLAWLWRSPSHINVLESSSFVTLLKKLLSEEGDIRFTALLDSRVAKGCHAKGRSSSKALQPTLRKSAAYQVAGGLYPAFGFAPTRLNTADAPTRDRDLPDSACHSLAELLPYQRLQACHARGLSRHASAWIRLTLLLLYAPLVKADGLFGLHHQSCCFSASDLLRPWIWIYGLTSAVWILALPILCIIAFLFGICLAGFLSCHSPPGLQCPRISSGHAFWIIWLIFVPQIWHDNERSHGKQPLPLACLILRPATAMPLFPATGDERERAARRSATVLIADRVVRPQTRSRREKLLDDFEAWLISKARITLAGLIDGPHVNAEEVSDLLVAYGKDLYYSGKAYGRYAETINAVCSKRTTLKRQVVGAWDLAFAWVADEPHSHHPAMPLSVLLAFAALGFLWGWPTEAAILLMTWSGLLRIGECLAATRKDLVLPGDGAPGIYFALLQIHQPKTRGVAAKHQAARIDPQDVVRILCAVFGKLDRNDRLWNFSSNTLRRRFSAIQKALGLPTRRSQDVIPYDLASLRPGGATHLLHQFEDAELVRRRGRWLSSRVCEIYLQEVMSTDGSEVTSRVVQLMQPRASQQAANEVGFTVQPSPVVTVAVRAAKVQPAPQTTQSSAPKTEAVKTEPVRLEEILRPIITPAARLRRDNSRDRDLQAPRQPAAPAPSQLSRAKARPRPRRVPQAVAPQATVSPAKVMQMRRSLRPSWASRRGNTKAAVGIRPGRCKAEGLRVQQQQNDGICLVWNVAGSPNTISSQRSKDVNKIHGETGSYPSAPALEAAHDTLEADEGELKQELLQDMLTFHHWCKEKYTELRERDSRELMHEDDCGPDEDPEAGVEHEASGRQVSGHLQDGLAKQFLDKPGIPMPPIPRFRLTLCIRWLLLVFILIACLHFLGRFMTVQAFHDITHVKELELDVDNCDVEMAPLPPKLKNGAVTIQYWKFMSQIHRISSEEDKMTIQVDMRVKVPMNQSKLEKISGHIGGTQHCRLMMIEAISKEVHLTSQQVTMQFQAMPEKVYLDSSQGLVAIRPKTVPEGWDATIKAERVNPPREIMEKMVDAGKIPSGKP
eukprot:s1300_g19.t1